MDKAWTYYGQMYGQSKDKLLLLLLLLLHTWCAVLLQGSTFGIPGVEQHAHFLRDVRHAEAIRGKLIENIALAGVPGQHVIMLHL
jgi:hypothetical protein